MVFGNSLPGGNPGRTGSNSHPAKSLERDGMHEETSTIEIHKKHNRVSTLKILLGLDDSMSLKDFLKKKTVPTDILNIAWVLDEPTRLPIILEIIHAIPNEENMEVRLSLVRAQIDASLRMNENLQKYTKQKFVAETIERLIFGDLMLEGKSSKNSGNSNGRGEGKKPVRKRQTPVKAAAGKERGSKKGS